MVTPAAHVTLVCGPPCSGKTTFVRQRAQPGDLVLDADVIGQRAMAKALRGPLRGRVWVIRCCPGARARQVLAAQLNAEVVLLLPEERVLMSRAMARTHPRRHVQAVRAWLRTEAAARDPLPRPMTKW